MYTPLLLYAYITTPICIRYSCYMYTSLLYVYATPAICIHYSCYVYTLLLIYMCMRLHTFCACATSGKQTHTHTHTHTRTHYFRYMLIYAYTTVALHICHVCCVYATPNRVVCSLDMHTLLMLWSELLSRYYKYTLYPSNVYTTLTYANYPCCVCTLPLLHM